MVSTRAAARSQQMPDGTYPKWFHHHGIKMRVEELSIDHKRLVLSASAASLKIVPFPDQDYWLVSWEVRLSLNERAQGQVGFSERTLRRAFGLATERTGEDLASSRWLLKQYGGDDAHQCRFIRSEDCLNIPCPGTGHDGDPNVSLLITDDIRDAVGKLIRG